MSKTIAIDFVADVSCPWCAISLRALEAAIDKLGDDLSVTIRFQPFELSPEMPARGLPLSAYMADRNGPSGTQLINNLAMVRARGADVGFNINTTPDSLVCNTFDAHRLIHWAGIAGDQKALKHALFEAYFTEGRSPSDHDVLVAAAERAGLDGQSARDVLSSGLYTEEVRTAERDWLARGIGSVPTIIVDGGARLPSGQSPATYAETLLSLAVTENHSSD